MSFRRQEQLVRGSEADPTHGGAQRECQPAPCREISRRTVLGGLGASLALILDGCGPTKTIPYVTPGQPVSGDPPPTSPPAPPTPPAPPAPPTPPALPVSPAPPPVPPVQQPISSTPQPVPTVPQPFPVAVQTVATATVSSTASGVLPDYFMGLSYEKGDFVSELLFTGSQTSLAGLFNRLGNGVLRIGGNSADTVLWNATGPGNTPGQVSPADVDNLADFLALTNWKLLYTLNLGTSTPALAAAEAAYVQARLGWALIGFEIGNEPDEYYLTYFPTDWTLQTYEALWQQFRQAVLASVPAASIVGPSTAGNITTWTVPFALGPPGQVISLLTQHYYRGNGHSVNATVSNLVSPDTTLAADCVALKSATTGSRLQFRFSETNSYLYGGSPGVSDAYASTLWVIDHLFTIAYGGGSGVNMQGGDVGDYTPIANNGPMILEARPEYYGLLMFTLIGQGELLPTTFSNKNFKATIYAVRAPSGGLNIVIVNKEVYQSLKITIDCGMQVNGAHLIQMTGPSLSALSGQMLQGATVSTDGSLVPDTPFVAYAAENINSPSVTCFVPAIAAILLQVY